MFLYFSFLTNVFSSDLNKFNDRKKIQELRINITDSRKWAKNILRIYKNFEEEDRINSKFKKKHEAKLNVIFTDNSKKEFSATVRTVGLNIFHFSKKNFLTSLEIKLNDGHINNITNFRLLLPESRLGDNEIFNTTLFSALGIIVPETFYVNTSINNTKQKFIFQETLSKELIEKNKYREGPIYVHSNNHRDDIILKIENSKWIKDDLEKFKLSLKGLQSLHYAYAIGNESDLSTEHINDQFKNFALYEGIMQATNSFHGLGIANRVIFYESMLNKYYPIYNDGKSRILYEKNINDNNFFKQSNLRNRYKNDADNLIKKIKNLNLNNFQKKN